MKIFSLLFSTLKILVLFVIKKLLILFNYSTNEKNIIFFSYENNIICFDSYIK